MEPSFTTEDDVSKLETKVVYAMSRLQKRGKPLGKRGKLPEVSTQQIVDYMMENYRYLDGDIESQVITALLSCVKIGFVCAQDNGTFRLLGANPRLMASNCFTRSVHGSKCSCSNLLNAVTRIRPNNCCTLQPRNKKKTAEKFPKPALKRTPANSPKSRSKGKLNLKPNPKPPPASTSPSQNPNKPKKLKCIQKMTQNLCETELNRMEGLPIEINLRKCSYCLKHHGKNGSGSKMCKKCYPPGIEFGIPPDKFSPREEVM